jgi:hypothetical protein
MADTTLELISPADTLERSVWVVVDALDFVTKQRVPGLDVRLRDVAARPIPALSGVYCFTDLDLPPGNYTAEVKPRAEARAHYFDAERQIALVTVPVPGQPLSRNPLRVELFPRPAYVFSGEATLVRGRLVKASNRAGIADAKVNLILETVERGRAGITDERGEFVVFLPPVTPDEDEGAVLKNLSFRLRFEIDGQETTTPPDVVLERTTKSLKEIEFPGT